MQTCTSAVDDNSSSVNRTTQVRCYTVEDLQIILNISRSSVYNLLKRKEFRWFKVGSHYRISKESFDQWLAKG